MLITESDNPILTLILAPVVVTAQTFQPTNSQAAFPVSVTTGVSSVNQTNLPSQTQQTTQQNIAMPMPHAGFPTSTASQPGNFQCQISSSTAPYPTNSSSTPYPINIGSAAPYPTQAPYPINVPQNTAIVDMDPPTYNQVVGKETYQKQPAFNPTYNS